MKKIILVNPDIFIGAIKQMELFCDSEFRTADFWDKVKAVGKEMEIYEIPRKD